MVLSGSTASWMKPCSCCLEARRMRFMRILPIPAPSSSAAMTTSAFFSVCRPRTPSSSPPNKGLVDLCAASEPFAARPHHRAPQLVQQRPGGAVASQTQNALQSQSTRPGFLARHPPHRPIPGAQRQTRILGKSCPPSAKPDNRIVHSAAGPADEWAELAVPHSGGTQNPAASGSCIRYSRHACSVTKRPSNILQRPRVVLHEPAYYMLGFRESSAYHHMSTPSRNVLFVAK